MEELNKTLQENNLLLQEILLTLKSISLSQSKQPHLQPIVPNTPVTVKTNSRPVRKGQRWTTEEDNELLCELESKVPWLNISEEHGRSEDAIKLRAGGLLRDILPDSNLADMSTRFHLTEAELKELMKMKPSYSRK